MSKKPWVRCVIAGTVLAVLFFVLLRNNLLQAAFNHRVASYSKHYGLQIKAEPVKFKGLDGITIKQLVVQPAGKDTLVYAELIELNISIIDLLTGSIGFDEIKASRVSITAYSQPQRNNISFLNRTDTSVLMDNGGEVNYRKRAEGYKTKLLRLFNTAFNVSDVNILYADSSAAEQLVIPFAQYDLRNFSALLMDQTNNDTLTMSAKVLHKKKSYRFEIAHASNKNIPYLPFLHNEKGLHCRFEKLGGLLLLEDKGDELEVSTNITTTNFCLGHWRLATEDVLLREGVFSGQLKVGEDWVQLDSSSMAAINGIKVKLFGAYNLQPEPVFQLGLHMPETVSDTFFNSLPQGVFNTLKGISCSGSLKYDLRFYLPTKRPDSLEFSSAMKRDKFFIRKYGADNYTRINGPFRYEAYDKDRFVRVIDVGPSNPNFTPFEQISSYLVKAVLQSEDPSFMQHNGFLEEAFCESIIKNYKEKRFARGGSTISMQLVKNVFLSRDKTISRKAEEALIVYLIENLNLVSKQRMLEVYLNVIEWGPNVYGIGEAARFYFNKHPSQLTLQESIFLAGIIPMPKHFKYQFDKEGNMKDYLSGYYRILSTRMVARGAIAASDTIGLVPDVQLTGPARRLVVPDDMSVLFPATE